MLSSTVKYIEHLCFIMVKVKAIKTQTQQGWVKDMGNLLSTSTLNFVKSKHKSKKYRQVQVLCEQVQVLSILPSSSTSLKYIDKYKYKYFLKNSNTRSKR